MALRISWYSIVCVLLLVLLLRCSDINEWYIAQFDYEYEIPKYENPSKTFYPSDGCRDRNRCGQIIDNVFVWQAHFCRPDVHNVLSCIFNIVFSILIHMWNHSILTFFLVLPCPKPLLDVICNYVVILTWAAQSAHAHAHVLYINCTIITLFSKLRNILRVC